MPLQVTEFGQFVEDSLAVEKCVNLVVPVHARMVFNHLLIPEGQGACIKEVNGDSSVEHELALGRDDEETDTVEIEQQLPPCENQSSAVAPCKRMCEEYTACSGSRSQVNALQRSMGNARSNRATRTTLDHFKK